jgi:hypothetical protein
MESKLSNAIKDKELDTLEALLPEELDDEVELEKPKPKRQGKNTGANWVLTPARAEALKKAQATLKKKNDLKRQEQDIKAEEERKVLEAKVIQKAIALKKRQLKKEQVIDSIPVEPGPLRRPKAVETHVPKYRFL